MLLRMREAHLRASSKRYERGMGFERVSEGKKREGWLVNMHPVSRSSF
jgi:hypothetical protein